MVAIALSSMSTLALLKDLAAVITSQVNLIEEICVQRGAQFPSLDTPLKFDNTPELEDTKDIPEISKAISQIVSAATELTATVVPSRTTLLVAVCQVQFSTALFTAETLNIAEILRDVGLQGMSIAEIASRAGTSPKKLSPVLRILATKHIFTEVAPDIFANNRLSSLLDSGRPLSELLDKAALKYNSSCQPIPALVHSLYEQSIPGIHLPNHMKDKSYAFAEEPNKALFNIVNKTPLTYFENLHRPENVAKREMFGVIMSAHDSRILEAFDWASLPPESVLVDVGSGVGSASLVVAKTYPHLNITLQDCAKLEDDAQHYWLTKYPEGLHNGRMTFQEHDFLQPQPVQGADVYLLRSILHDWSDTVCTRILQQLRGAASEHSKLVIVDGLLEYAVRDQDGLLIKHNEPVNFVTHGFSMLMSCSFNGQERTLPQFKDLLKKTGWKLVYAKRPDPSYKAAFLAVPV